MNASTKAKRKYNNANYDRIEVSVKKGNKELLKKHAEILGVSLSEYIKHLIEKDLNIDL